MARSNGNIDLHRFLAVADGVVRAQGRKIIFTTNLPNIGDIDEALVRPGRCFATLRTRALERSEAASLLARIAAARRERNEPARTVALAAEVAVPSRSPHCIDCWIPGIEQPGCKTTCRDTPRVLPQLTDLHRETALSDSICSAPPLCRSRPACRAWSWR